MGLFSKVKNWIMPDDEEELQDFDEKGATIAFSGDRVKIRIETPRDFVEGGALLKALKEHSCILVNLNHADASERRRLYDYLDGARSYAGGMVAEVAEEVFMFSLQQSNVEKKFTGQTSAFTIDEIKKKHNLI